METRLVRFLGLIKMVQSLRELTKDFPFCCRLTVRALLLGRADEVGAPDSVDAEILERDWVSCERVEVDGLTNLVEDHKEVVKPALAQPLVLEVCVFLSRLRAINWYSILINLGFLR